MQVKKAIPFFSKDSIFLKQVILEASDDNNGVFIFAFFKAISNDIVSLCQDLELEKLNIETKLFIEIVKTGLISNSKQISKLSIEIIWKIVKQMNAEKGKIRLLLDDLNAKNEESIESGFLRVF